MNNNKIDELFRTRLEAHPVTPSPEAWAKLQGKMNTGGRKKGIYWMSAAAAVSLIIFAGWMVYRSGSNDIAKQQVLANQNEVAPVPQSDGQSNTQSSDLQVITPSPQVATSEQRSTEATEEATSQTVKPVDANKKGTESKKSTQPMQPTGTQLASAPQNEEVKKEALMAHESINNITEVKETIEVPAQIAIEPAETKLAEVAAPVQPMEVKITFKADDDERFLDPVRELIASEMPDKEKKSGFNKLLASARNLSNRDILSELRDSKDDLFSGNIRIGNTKNEKVNNSK